MFPSEPCGAEKQEKRSRQKNRSAGKQKKAKEWQFNIFIANTDTSKSIESCCGILVSVRHGDTTTYFIGISGKVGRELQVNYLLFTPLI